MPGIAIKQPPVNLNIYIVYNHELLIFRFSTANYTAFTFHYRLDRCSVFRSDINIHVGHETKHEVWIGKLQNTILLESVVDSSLSQ